jgi:hypothetical protein
MKDHSLCSDDGKVVLGNENLEENADVRMHDDAMHTCAHITGHVGRVVTCSQVQ